MNIKELVVETLKENKKLIIGLYALFIIVFIATWIMMAPKVANMPTNATAVSTLGPDSSALELFIHNESSGLMTYIGSIFFGILAIVMIIYNGYSIGMMSLIRCAYIDGVYFLICHHCFHFSIDLGSGSFRMP